MHQININVAIWSSLNKQFHSNESFKNLQVSYRTLLNEISIRSQSVHNSHGTQMFVLAHIFHEHANLDYDEIIIIIKYYPSMSYYVLISIKATKNMHMYARVICPISKISCVD